jgi:type II secretory pathway component PulF
LTLASLVHVLAIPLGIVVVVALAISWTWYRRSQQAMLLWSIGCAARRGLPLPDAVAALEDEHGASCRQLAFDLRLGMPLAESVRLLFGFPSAEAQVGATVASHFGRLEELAQPQDNSRADQVLDKAALGVLYLFLVVIATFVVLAYLGVQIVPVLIDLRQELSDQPSESPWWRSWLQEVQWTPGESLFADILLVVVAVLGAALLLGALLRCLRVLPADIPLLRHLGQPHDRASILRSLAVAVESERSISEVIGFLATTYPRSLWRARLEQAQQRIAQGADWIESLRQIDVFSAADAAMARSAQRARNLDWVLRELATAQLRRYAYRLQVTFQIVTAIVITALGCLVLLAGCFVLLPLLEIVGKFL